MVTLVPSRGDGLNARDFTERRFHSPASVEGSLYAFVFMVSGLGTMIWLGMLPERALLGALWLFGLVTFAIGTIVSGAALVMGRRQLRLFDRRHRR